MSEFKDFFSTLGFPAATAALAMWLIYKVGSKLVDQHIKTLGVVEETQTKLLESQTKLAQTMSEMLKTLDRISQPMAEVIKTQDRLMSTHERVIERLESLDERFKSHTKRAGGSE